MKVVLITATYNEKGNVERLITLLEEKVIPQLKQHAVQILIADDNSPDGTAKEVEKLMKKWDNLSLNSGPKKGLGAAYIRAMSYAIEKMNADVVMSMDADLSHDPLRIPAFLQKIESGYDVVVGTRYSEGGSMPENWPFHRKMYSVFGNLLVRTITLRFALHDWTGGFRAIKKEVFLKEKPKVLPFNGYTFQVAFLYKAILDGYTVGEVPIHFADRTMGKSKIAPSEYIFNLLKYVISERIHELIFGTFGKFLVVGGIGFVINAVMLKILVDYYHFNPTIANLTGAAVAIFSNFNFNNLWTFRHSKFTTVSTYFLKMINFYLTSAFGVIFIQTGVIFIGDAFISRKYYFYYFLVGTALLLIWNFFIYSFVIWKKHPQK